MSSDSWADMAARWREIYDENAALARKTWLDGQAELAKVFPTSDQDDPNANATALADLWRSWISFGDSLWGGASKELTDGWPSLTGFGALTEPITVSLAGGGAVNDVLRRMAEGPRLADMGTSEKRTARVMERWLAVQESARSYESVVAAAWADANTRFAERLSKGSAEGGVPDAKESLRLWLDTANDVLLETHRSEKFLTVQRKLLRDGMDFMLAEREFIESLVEPAGLPTRSEIDEIHRNVHDLKRRVRDLEKQLELHTKVETPAPTTESGQIAEEGTQP